MPFGRKMNRAEKEAVVASVAAVAKGSVSLVAAEYRGMNVEALTSLRVQARAMGVHLQVVRNNLARIAFQDTEFACVQEALVGPLLLAFSKSDPGAAARLVRDFSKDCEALKTQVLSIGGRLLPADQLEVLAKLPTRNEAIARLMATMKAPITQLVRTMAEPQVKCIRTLLALRDQRQG